MPGQPGRHSPTFEQCPALASFLLRRVVIMHKVPVGQMRLLRWNRMWIGLSSCAVMCFPRRALPQRYEFTWCPRCFSPGGPGVQQRAHVQPTRPSRGRGLGR